jgi:hypothetical protein
MKHKKFRMKQILHRFRRLTVPKSLKISPSSCSFSSFHSVTDVAYMEYVQSAILANEWSVFVKCFSVSISMLVLSTIMDIQDQNTVNARSQNLKSKRCNFMECSQSKS